MIEAIDVSRAEAIEGWMAFEELSQLAAWAVERERIVEIGSHVGRSTCALAQHTPGFVLAVDTWEGEYNGTTERRAKFEANLADLISNFRVRILEADSATLWETALGFSPDMVFIDGDHHYEPFAKDIRWALTRLVPSGLVCGHDADIEDVKTALNELLPAWQSGPGCLWWALKA